MTSVMRSRRSSDSGGKVVRYTPCKQQGEQTDEEELEELEVLRGASGSTPSAHSASSSRANNRGGGGATIGLIENGGRESETMEHTFTTDSDIGSSATGGGPTANGPRSLPGSLNASGSNSGGGERTRVIGERLASVSTTGRMTGSSPCYSQKDNEQDNAARAASPSRSSVFEAAMAETTFEIAKANRKVLKDYSHAIYDNKAQLVEPVTPKEVRKQRRKEIQERFGKKSKNDHHDASTDSSEKDGCKFTFVFDPAGRFSYWWSSIVSIAFIYNFWVIIYRFAFEEEEINKRNLATWFTLDYCADFLYVLDIVFHFRTGYLEDGVLQTDGIKLRIHYMNSTMFYIDCLCLLPLDFLYLSIGFNSMLRCFRLVKIYRFWAFLDRTERHTNYPNLIRTVTLLHYLFAIYHWNACVMYMVTIRTDQSHVSVDDDVTNQNNNKEEEPIIAPPHVVASSPEDQWNFIPENDSVFDKYLHCLYCSTMVLTTIGGLPAPQTRGQYVFVIAEFVFGLLLFSAVLGNVANIVTNISAARKDFQARLDSVKTYMSLRRVPLRLQDRVIKWFDYLWLSKKSSDEDKTLNLLPDKLKAEIALHVHLDTLKRVEIFQNTEAGFLCELVLKLRPVLFSPGDYICRKGEVGKEMYIVNRGRLQVVADGAKTILATLRPGSYFGEISILNMGNEGNRRTASVKSVGYSDLFMLSKKDLWDVLKDYPTARVRLEAIAQKRVANYKKAPLEQATLPRSKSTPGLVESAGKIPIQAMVMNRHNTLPNTLLSPQVSLDSNGDCSTSAGGTNGTGNNTETGSRAESGKHSRLSSARTRDSDEIILNTSLRRNSNAELSHSMTASSITSYIADVSRGASRTNLPVTYHPLHCAAMTPHHVNNPVTLIAPSAFRPVGETAAGGYPSMYHHPHHPGTTLGPPPVVNAHPASPIPFTDGLTVVAGALNHDSSNNNEHAQLNHNIHNTHAQQQPPSLSAAAAAAQLTIPSMTYLPAPSPSQPLLGVADSGGGSIATRMSAVSPVPSSLSPYSPHRGGAGSFQTLHHPAISPHPHPHHPQPGSNHSNSPSFLSTGSNTLNLPGNSISGSHLPTSPSVLPPYLSPNQSAPQLMNMAHAPRGDSQQHETLLAEITRLRDRLQSLEKENSTMSVKLNKQQWDVENRLSEIEMHFCGSESACSRPDSFEENKSLHGNRESII